MKGQNKNYLKQSLNNSSEHIFNMKRNNSQELIMEKMQLEMNQRELNNKNLIK